MIVFESQIADLVDRQAVADLFIPMLPSIERAAAYGFRRVQRHRREELIANVVAIAYKAFVRLIELGKAALVYPSVLARYAIRHVRAGRRVGAVQNSQDVLSPTAQRRHTFSVQLLSQRDGRGDWEQLTTGRKSDPAAVAACRIDFRSWLSQLKAFKRRLAIVLANGATTNEAAQQFRLTPGRVSQLRRELADSWRAFQALPALA